MREMGWGRLLEVLREVYERNKENKLSQPCLKNCKVSDSEASFIRLILTRSEGAFMRNLIIYTCIGCL